MQRPVTQSLAVLLLGLSACGQPQQPGDATPDHSAAASTPQSGLQPAVSRNRVGQGHGRVISVDGDALVIEHGPLSGLDMGAMTMRFETVYAVSAADFAAGDEVAFRVKEGRDRVYRVIAVCAAPPGDTACLDHL